MYNPFFGFKSNPFQLLPDPEFLFLSKVHKRALTYLHYGLTSDSGGFIVISGEVGTGKTTVIRSIMKGLEEKFVFSRINNTRLTSAELISMINDDFGLDVKGKDKTQILRDLSEFLIEQYIKGKKCILIIDEAHNLTTEHLEEIRLLSNLETDKSKLLQIILVGQPELRQILALPELRSFRQRTNVSCHIYPLTREETEKYIFHRLEVAGNRDAIKFQDGAIDLIHNFARGVPRLINITCDFLLLSAFIDQTKEIALSMVKEVIDDLEQENMYWQDESCDNHRDSITNLEEKLERKNGNSDYGRKMKIFTKVSSAEKLLGDTTYRLRAELEDKYTLMDARLNEMARRISDIGSQLKK